MKSSNSNWTKWRTYKGVIVQVISKSDEREAQGRLEISSMITTWIVWYKVQLQINYWVAVGKPSLKMGIGCSEIHQATGAS